MITAWTVRRCAYPCAELKSQKLRWQCGYTHANKQRLNRRKLSHFRGVAEAALWFTESFSLVSNQIVRASTENLPFPKPASHGKLGGA